MECEILPNGWRSTKLGELGEVNRGRSRYRPRDAAHLYGGRYAFIQTGDVKGADGLITQHQQTYSEAGLAQSRLWPAGTMCITIAANIAETALLAYPACFPDSVVGFIGDPERCSVRFIEYVFRKLKLRIQGEASGSVQDNINLATIDRLRFPLPPVAEQYQIASFIGAFDDRIRAIRSANRTFELTASAIFKSWFVDFDPVWAKAEGREPEGMDAATAASVPDELVGSLPDGWVKIDLGTISTVGIGKTPPRGQPQWFSTSSSDVVWVSIRDMGKSGVYIGDSAEYLTREAVNEFNVRIVPDNTVIVSFKLTVGRLAITDGNVTTNEAIAHCVLTQDSHVTVEYLYCALSAFDFTSLASTSSIAEAVNSKTIRNLQITIPPRPLVDVFSGVVQSMFLNIKNNQRLISTLSELRDTLLPRLISGKLRVPEAEKLVEAVL